MTKDDFKVIMKEADDDLKIPQNLLDKQKYRENYPGLIQKWTKYYTLQLRVVAEITIQEAEMVAKLDDDYKYNKKKAYDGRMLTDAVAGDPVYCTLKRKKLEQEYYLNFIRETMENVKGIPFTLRDWIEMEKLKQMQ